LCIVNIPAFDAHIYDTKYNYRTITHNAISIGLKAVSVLLYIIIIVIIIILAWNLHASGLVYDDKNKANNYNLAKMESFQRDVSTSPEIKARLQATDLQRLISIDASQ